MAPAPSAVALFVLSSCLWAQPPAEEIAVRTVSYTPPPLILHAETDLVTADLTVRDDGGHPMAGLHADDVELFDNGVRRKISAFSEVRKEDKAEASPAPSAPKYITIFFDDLHMGVPGPSGGFAVPFVKKAAREFAAKYMKPGDRIAIATTSGAADLDFTDNASLFDETADQLTYRGTLYSSFAEYHQGEVNTLAAAESAVQRLVRMPGVRMLLFLSAGFTIHIDAAGVVYDCEPQLRSFIDAAVHGNVLVQVIDAKGLSTDSSSPMRRPLFEIAQGTGGHLFENSNDISGEIELAAYPEVGYELAFDPGVRDGKFHTLKIKFKSKRSGTLEIRPGYLSNKDDPDKKLIAREPFDAAVFSNEALTDLPATVSLSGGQPQNGAVPVSVSITVDVSHLPFTNSHGRHMQQLAFLMTLLDANGNFVTGKESIMELSLTDERLASLEKTGLKAVATLTAPAGVYEVRTVVREGVKGRLAAATTGVRLKTE